jgi:NADH-quinone oxidoreductase subunit C
MVDTPAADDAAPEPTEAEPPPPALRHGVPVATAPGVEVLFPSLDEVTKVVAALHAEGYLMCVDVTAVDYLTYGRRTLAEGDIVATTRTVVEGIEPERFEVVYHFLRHTDHDRVRVRVQVPEAEPTVPSLFDRYPGTEAMEREVYDMFGITFDGHPDLTRILMPEDWVGHPLRKDYSSGRIPVQFKASADERATRR